MRSHQNSGFDDIAHLSHGFEHAFNPKDKDQLLAPWLPKAWHLGLLTALLVDTLLTIVFASSETCPPTGAYVIDGLITFVFVVEVLLNLCVWGVRKYCTMPWYQLGECGACG